MLNRPRFDRRFHARLLALGACFALPWLLLGASRVLFFFWNHDFFQTLSRADILHALAAGAMFDAAASALISAPFFLVFLLLPVFRARVRLGVFIALLLVWLPLLFLHFVDVELVRFTLRRSDVHHLFLFQEAGWHVRDMVAQYWSLTLIGVSALVLLSWALHHSLRRILRAPDLAQRPCANWRQTVPRLGLNALSALIVLSLLVLLLRGGATRSLPLDVVDAPVTPGLDLLALNTPFTFLKAFNKPALKPKTWFADEAQLLRILTPRAAPLPPLDHPPRNIVVLIMESMAFGYLGRANGVLGFTPFLDELASEGLLFVNAYNNRMGSISGVPAVLASVPGFFREHHLESIYAHNPLTGLGNLKAFAAGAFFHGADRTTMHFDRLAPMIGLTRHYSKEDYPDARDDDGSWGIFDKPFFAFMARTLDTFPQPFAAAAFSLSAHGPHIVPTADRATLPRGELPILQSIAYSDSALHAFFSEARRHPWHKDTLYVITGDHGNAQYLPQFQSSLGSQRIPILFYQEGRIWPDAATLDRTQPASQIDILPTLADMLGLPQRQRNYLAHSLWSSGSFPIALRQGETLCVIDRKEFLLYPLSGNDDAPQQAALFSLSDTTMRSPLPAQSSPLLSLAKAIEQYFIESMLTRNLLRAELDNKP